MNRESATIQRSEILRKCRKGLLAELSSLVKSAKRLQETQRGTLPPTEDINDIVDEMILKAFKIVNRGVRFLDVLDEDRRARAPASVTVMATVLEESYVPPTPPADRTRFEDQRHETASEADSRAMTDDTAASVATSDLSEALQPWAKRMSSLSSISPAQQRRLSQAGPSHNRRLSASMSHRVSLVGPSPTPGSGPLISDRLNRSHDRFLSHLGSFIGRLHWQSLSRQELSVAIKQCAASGGELLGVIDGVCANCIVAPVTLQVARTAVFERIQELVFAARDTIAHVAAEDADVIIPHDSNILLASATACVKATGECVAKAKAVIERIGDFEHDVEDDSLGIDLSVLDIAPDYRSRTPSAAGPSEAVSFSESAHVSDGTSSSQQSPGQSTRVVPKVPKIMIPSKDSSPSTSRTTPSNNDGHPASASSSVPARSSLPPLPKLTTAISPADHTPLSSSRTEESHSARFENVAATSAGSSTTYLSRDSETSILSQTSTRATTPDNGQQPRSKPSMSELSNADSSATNAEEPDELESKLLEKTYAHELMFNKEGQITGGTLPALIERLTAHESTPDATFVSTFFLTFRLFCTPVKLTTTLIDRFDYVADSPQMAGPVRLRVYNAFKGWLECHWRDDTDQSALPYIVPFAQGKLAAVLPSAGRRLAELAIRASSENMQASRVKFSIGKTNTVIGQYVPAEVPLSQPSISKHQHHLLNAFKAGTNTPSIMDFEPLELARQLTLLQMNIFCAIMPEELIGSRWMKNGGMDAPNVKAMSSLSTDLSNFVAETVLQFPEVKKRATVIKQWIKIAGHCNELHNYDGLMAIVCSLNSSTISRLRKTWDIISDKRKETFRMLQRIVDPSQNNKILRMRLQDHVPPCLPFLGMYLTDLTFIDMGNAATKKMSLAGGIVEEGSRGLTVVNFDKHTRTAKIIGELQRFQIPHRLTELPDMQEWLTTQIQRVRETGKDNVQVSNYRKSLLLEPREARRDAEPPTPVATSATSGRGDLFGWMSRDRGAHSTAPAPV